jgi:hypothetical protein
VDRRRLLQKREGLPQGDRARGLDRITIDTAADGGESDSLDPMLQCELESCSITGSERYWLTLVASSPYRTYGMDNESGRESIALRDLGITGGTTA